MWHVAVQYHAGADILLTVHLFSYYCEVVQIVSQPTNTEYVWYEVCFSSSIYRIMLTRFVTLDGHCICTLNNCPF